MGWLIANTSGVVVIQIRDHVSQNARVEIGFDRASPFADPVARIFNDLTPWMPGTRSSAVRPPSR